MTWAPDYVTSAELKSFMRISDSDDDALIALWITDASRAVDKHCGRQFGQCASVEAREYTPQYDTYRRSYTVEIDDLMTTSGLIVLDEDTTEVTDYTFQPVNASQKGRPYERMWVETSSTLTITARWGWTAVPAAVKVATLIQASRFAARRDSPYGVAGSPSDGSELRLLAALDPDVKTSLSAFRRDWWAA